MDIKIQVQFSRPEENTELLTCIRTGMRRRLVCGLIAFMLLAWSSAIGAEGMFQGTVVDPPTSEPSPPGWIFVKGRNRMLRRVEVAHAKVFYGSEVPASQKHSCHSECIETGQVVRILAEQDSEGEWRAKQVIILELATNRT